MNELDKALSTVETMDPETAAKTLFDLFHKIGQMDRAQIIAAYHTFVLFCEKTKQDSKTGTMHRIRTAILVQMIYLVSKESGMARQRLIWVFLNAKGINGIEFHPFWKSMPGMNYREL